MDVALAIDTSNALSVEDFQGIKTFAKQLMNAGANSENNVHFGVLQFSEDAQTMLNFREYKSEHDVWAVLDGLEQTGNAARRVDEALRLALEEVLSLEGGVRQGHPRYLIVFISGNPSSTDEELSKAAEAIKAYNVTVIVINIGARVDSETLLRIASGREFLFGVENAAELRSRAPTLQKSLCHGKSSEHVNTRRSTFQIWCTANETQTLPFRVDGDVTVSLPSRAASDETLPRLCKYGTTLLGGS